LIAPNTTGDPLAALGEPRTLEPAAVLEVPVDAGALVVAPPPAALVLALLLLLELPHPVTATAAATHTAPAPMNRLIRMILLSPLIEPDMRMHARQAKNILDLHAGASSASCVSATPR
jgi:hypothetical protein